MLDKNVLSELKLFQDVVPEKLEKIARESEVIQFKRGEMVFRQDEPAINVYFVLDGEVELNLNFKDMVLKADIRYEESNFSKFEYMEKPIVVDTVSPGEIFGWSALLGSAIETSNARCSEDSRLVSISAAGLKDLFQTDPSLGYVIMFGISEVISQRLRNRTDKLIEAWGQAFGTSEI